MPDRAGRGPDERVSAPSALDLRADWRALLDRRPSLAGTLSVYDGVLERWAHAAPGVAPLRWTAAECREQWGRRVPLLADAPVLLPKDDVEALLAPALDLLASVGNAERPAVQRFAEAWDAGEIGPASLFPVPGRVGALGASIGLPPDTIAFLACASLRPSLDALFIDCRPWLADGDWGLGVCPFCGGPPGFADVTEDGERRLACHLCGGGWVVPRLRCPLCGNDSTRDLARLEPEGKEEGYVLSTCRQCRAYVKELDRRVRWNGGRALVEDWGSPHLDLIAHREGYWRPCTPLIPLAARP